ncbi:MAG: dihydrodipicolinate synthase family protein [Paludibacter sp.]|jgi:4-hydroxy-tetrahydrodipicolinate synthase|nr:dihydrodipicolinate synthase family protein [Paludibacter sp.]
MKNIIKGIIPPMITPLLNPDTLDVQGVANLVEHLIGGDVNGIFILGTTGEAQQLSTRLKKELIAQSAKCINGRLPLLVGITDCTVEDSLIVAEFAAKHGATAAVAAPPYFFALSKSELYDYYTTLADKSPLPVFLYNMPSHTKAMMDLDLVEKLAQHPNIAGLKDSSANGVYFCKLLKMFASRPDFGLYVGPEEMFAPMVLMGGHGGVSGGANVYPKFFAELYAAAAKCDVATTLALQSRMLEVGEKLFGIGQYSAGYIKGIKTALKQKSIINADCMAHPFSSLNADDSAKVAQALQYLDSL